MRNDLDDCFTELCPFPPDTFSGHDRPCPVIDRSPNPAKPPCPYAEYCSTEWNRKYPLRVVLELSYQAQVAITLAEPSGSFVLRSEHLFLGRERYRMSFRRHIYEVLDPPPGTPAATFPDDRRCPALTRETCLGLYIGYVDLRWRYQASPLALGVLAIPRKLAVDPDAHVIAGNYSPLFGGPSFPCNVYSMQDNQTGGAACAQACIIMVLGMLADRGAKLEGSYTLTQLGYYGEDRIPLTTKPVPDALKQKVESDSRIERIFPAKGLTPDRIKRVLDRLGIRATVVRLCRDLATTTSQQPNVWEKLAARMIECHVQARYPVILCVEAGKWGANPGKPVGHAVTIVGIRKGSHQKREEQFIVHDPAQKPFVEKPMTFCFTAGWALGDKTTLALITPTEQAVSRSLMSCHDTMYRTGPHVYKCLLEGQNRLHPGAVFDYQFSLEYRKDIHTFLWPVSLEAKDCKDLNTQFQFVKTRYWCLAGYKNQVLKLAWFFPSDGKEEDGWELQLFLNEVGDYVILRQNGESMKLILPEVLKSYLRRAKEGLDDAG